MTEVVMSLFLLAVEQASGHHKPHASGMLRTLSDQDHNAGRRHCQSDQCERDMEHPNDHAGRA
jgi:hypothetical protein